MGKLITKGFTDREIDLVLAKLDRTPRPRQRRVIAESMARAVIGRDAIAALKGLWEWQKTVEELPPVDVADAVRKALADAGEL